MLDRIRIGDALTGQKIAQKGSHFVINVARKEENPFANVHIELCPGFDSACVPSITTDRLDLVADAIEHALRVQSKPIYIHCSAGIERSPLSVIWYLHQKCDTHLEDAFDLVKRHHSDTENRLGWISYKTLEESLRHRS